MSAEYLAAVKGRRTYYPLKKESPIPDEKIQQIVGDAILHAPTSFNSQASRAVLLLKDEHDKLWDIVKDSLKAVVSEEQYKVTEQKLNMFQGAYGTVSYQFSFHFPHYCPSPSPPL
jgi:predicted oxidoreductase (fatty acid repression mutant protein)